MRQIVIKNQIFSSFKAACDHFSVDDSYLSKKSKKTGIAKEQLLEEKLGGEIRTFKFSYEGITYSSYSQCCRELGLDPDTVHSLVSNRRITKDEALHLALQHKGQVPRERKGYEEVVEGVRYPSRNAALRAYGLSQQTVLNQMETGLSFEEAVVTILHSRKGL